MIVNNIEIAIFNGEHPKIIQDRIFIFTLIENYPIEEIEKAQKEAYKNMVTRKK